MLINAHYVHRKDVICIQKLSCGVHISGEGRQKESARYPCGTPHSRVPHSRVPARTSDPHPQTLHPTAQSAKVKGQWATQGGILKALMELGCGFGRERGARERGERERERGRQEARLAPGAPHSANAPGCIVRRDQVALRGRPCCLHLERGARDVRRHLLPSSARPFALH